MTPPDALELLGGPLVVHASPERLILWCASEGAAPLTARVFASAGAAFETEPLGVVVSEPRRDGGGWYAHTFDVRGAFRGRAAYLIELQAPAQAAGADGGARVLRTVFSGVP